MQRGRSPFFSFALILLAGIGFAAGLAAHAYWGAESWHTNTALVDRANHIAIRVALLCAIPLVALALLELALRRGWEPKRLRIRYTGVLVVEKAPRLEEPSEGWLGVVLPGGRHERYFADKDEFGSTEEGHLVILEVFGKYVAGIRRMEGSSAREAEQELAAPEIRNEALRQASIHRPRSAGFWTWTLAIAGPILGGYLIGLRAMVFQTGELKGYMKGTMTRPGAVVDLDPADARASAWIFAGLGVAMILVSIFVWRRGWRSDDAPREFWLWGDWRSYY